MNEASVLVVLAYQFRSQAKKHIFKIVVPNPYNEADPMYNAYPSIWKQEVLLLGDIAGEVQRISEEEIWVTLIMKSESFFLPIASIINPPTFVHFSNMTIQYGYQTTDDDSSPYTYERVVPFQFPQTYYSDLNATTGYKQGSTNNDFFPIIAGRTTYCNFVHPDPQVVAVYTNRMKQTP